MAELESRCRTPSAQASCCEPEDKASCCDETHGHGWMPRQPQKARR
jgi:hypothetical protein